MLQSLVWAWVEENPQAQQLSFPAVLLSGPDGVVLGLGREVGVGSGQ